MCNLSQGIKEQAYAEGTENGIAKGIAKIILKYIIINIIHICFCNITKYHFHH